jgi:hypothetical protein
MGAAVDAVLGDARRIVVSHERPELTCQELRDGH